MTEITELNNPNNPCFCGRGKNYLGCCKPLHDSIAIAQTAEELMRSRYSAFALGLRAYLLKTWHESTRPGCLEFEIGLVWKGLDIKKIKKGKARDTKGWVHFKAKYQVYLESGTLEENSFFLKDKEGIWFYVDGDVFG